MTIDKLIASMTYDIAPRLKRTPFQMDDTSIMYAVERIGRNLCPEFRVDEANKEVLLNLAKWTLGLPFEAINPVTKRRAQGRTDKGIIITGPTGTGKTLATKVLYYLAKMTGQAVTVDSGRYSLLWPEKRAEDLCDEYARNGSITSVSGTVALCIHDLGSEPNETLYMGNRVPVMRQLIERWGERNDRLLIVTTNLPLYYNPKSEAEKARPTILKQYGARAESRLVEMCNYFYLGGDDRRVANIKENK